MIARIIEDPAEFRVALYESDAFINPAMNLFFFTFYLDKIKKSMKIKNISRTAYQFLYSSTTPWPCIHLENRSQNLRM